MSVNVAPNAYHARFVFGDRSQGSSAGNPNVAPAATPVATTRARVTSIPASSTLAGALDQAGLSRGGTSNNGVAADTRQDGQPAGGPGGEKTAKLQDALATLLDALGPSSRGSSPGGNGVQDAIQTILGALAPGSTGVSALDGSGSDQNTAPARPAEDGDDASATVKPNLDKLNRVLSHYTAQSAASATVLSLLG